MLLNNEIAVRLRRDCRDGGGGEGGGGEGGRLCGGGEVSDCALWVLGRAVGVAVEGGGRRRSPAVAAILRRFCGGGCGGDCGGNCGAKMAGAMATGSGRRRRGRRNDHEGGGEGGELDVRRWLLVRLGEAAAWCCSEAEAAGKC